jgi:hypothetical protein
MRPRTRRLLLAEVEVGVLLTLRAETANHGIPSFSFPAGIPFQTYPYFGLRRDDDIRPLFSRIENVAAAPSNYFA